MNYNFQKQLVRIWENAEKLYRDGNTSPETFPIQQDLSFLHSIGLNKMDIFDYVEDWICEGAPDQATFILIHSIRRTFFVEEQRCIPSIELLDSQTLPGKTEEIEGIRWLPRILAKARAKLRGELPADTMFCCGGDRAFFARHDIHPAEFLQVVQKAEMKDQLVVDWVKTRINQSDL